MPETVKQEPRFEIKYSDTFPIKGWFFCLFDNEGKEVKESNVFADDGVKIEDKGRFLGMERGKALALQCAEEDLENLKLKIKKEEEEAEGDV